MAETVLRLRQAGAALRESGEARAVTSNTIRHPTNGYDIADLPAEAVRGLSDDEAVIGGT
ncbi:hypothetical protein [Falsiroseomonas tokyonensis]|uniref:Uncharacterized protein n=1 Tax=Falsiroseomonas tokyonensis TaxID=430521 RepID=A0ABV7C3A3_9PROT|nr:hypothetical protein [Falsiroseomonas tokyonensis]MBU8541430.1 hypothetical protein [Falsiroseomonas tokyonensis]